jgi:hypothetical protein
MQPYMYAQYVKIAFMLILDTGAIPDACRDWKHHTRVKQTWADFRREFARAKTSHHLKHCRKLMVSHCKCSRSLNVQIQLPDDGGFVTAMENFSNLDTDTSADRETVASLTKAIATLADQLSANDMWDKSHEAELKRLLGGRATTAPIVTDAPGAAYVRKSYKTKNDNYCWTHGYQVGLAHTSANCTKNLLDTRMQPPRKIPWEVILGEANFFDKVGTFR